MDKIKFPKVVIKVGFIDEGGNLFDESVRILEWPMGIEGIGRSEFMKTLDDWIMSDPQAEVTIPANRN